MRMKQEHKPCEGKDSGTLYKIGMFAAINHVTVKTLRFLSVIQQHAQGAEDLSELPDGCGQNLGKRSHLPLNPAGRENKRPARAKSNKKATTICRGFLLVNHRGFEPRTL